MWTFSKRFCVASNRSKWPGWVRLALWGISNRILAWVFFGISITLTLASIGFGFIDPAAFLGIIFVLAAAWYYFAIRWVDRHDGWR
jgi:hypothetical protein